ncbi:MAG: GNAT family N-acetyltransferase [Nitriliruptoraceae bacterium]
MPPSQRPRAEVHLRMLVPDDAAWVARMDQSAATSLARPIGFTEDALRRELEAGEWASDARFGWAILLDGTTAGFALVDDLDRRDAELTLRVAPQSRGRGAGREVLRQLADHHFAATPTLRRLTGRAHEHNVPMQRVFNAAGFRMEARYRDSLPLPDGSAASEWGYALTRADWEAGRHRASGTGYDLHGLAFGLDETIEGEDCHGLRARFLQEGRRVLWRYDADHQLDGEAAGVLTGDLLRYRFVHTREAQQEVVEVPGRGRARLQRREDGRLEIVDRWSDERGSHGERVLVQLVDDR